MTLPLTPPILEAAYEFLRACPPYSSWCLPPGEEIELQVLAMPDREGDYTRYCRSNDHIIGISAKRIGHTHSLLQVMGHEMIHLKQAVAKTETKAAHNAEFRRLAAQVCAVHGWDERLFV